MGAIDTLPLDDTAGLFAAIGRMLGTTMGGSSGILLAIYFSAAADAAASGADVVTALRAGLARIQQVGGAQLGGRTMIDALAPALDALDSGIAAAAGAARNGADRTAGMSRATSGRAAYVGATQLAGHVDPGAEAVARVFAALAEI